jgi:sugar transferase (PEP-CTERM/EpsH1 system associated)
MSAKRAVLWITPKLPLPLVSGDKVRQYNLLRRLSARHDIHLVAFLERPWDAQYIPALEAFCAQVTAVPLPPRQPRVARALAVLDPRKPFYVHRYASAGMRAAVAAAVAQGVCDIVQVEHEYMLPYVALLGAAKPPARIVTLHNIESRLTARCAAVERSPTKRLYWRIESRKLAALERRCLPALDAVLPVSEYDRRWVEATFPGLRAVTVENGVDTEQYTPGPDGLRTPSLLFTGSLAYPPNADAVDFLLGAVWPAVRQAVPRATCTIVGRDPPAALVACHGRDGVAVTGQVDDVRAYLVSAGVVVVPLRAGGGTRLKILEAMAAGAAIVSTPMGAEGLDVVHDRHLLLAEDAGGFTAATVRVLSDPDLRRRLGSAARRLAEERYDWRVSAGALDRAYQLVTGGG